MDREQRQNRRNRLHISRSGILIAVSGILFAVGFYSLTEVGARILALSFQMSLLSGWLLSGDPRCRSESPIREALASPSVENGLVAIIANLQTLNEMPDGLARECVLSKIAGMDEDVRQLAAGRIVFANTETWRTAYEKVLSAPGVTEYRSVAWVKTGDYWQDRPGQQSIRLNYNLLDRGVEIQRIVILGWNLWQPELPLPSPAIRRWLEEQHYRGIALSLVRESDLVNEPDLLRDLGIYGTRATGEQELDEQSRTVRFELRFDEPGIRLATDRWERLKLYARPLTELLDRDAIGE